VVLRFIEYMDVGASNGWRMDEVLPSAQVVQRSTACSRCEPLEPAPPARPPSAGATATAAARSA
jgi:cyclic pyranopterin phosphate synthase